MFLTYFNRLEAIVILSFFLTKSNWRQNMFVILPCSQMSSTSYWIIDVFCITFLGSKFYIWGKSVYCKSFDARCFSSLETIFFKLWSFAFWPESPSFQNVHSFVSYLYLSIVRFYTFEVFVISFHMSYSFDKLCT